LFTTHPIDEAVLAVGRAVAGEELEQHHAVGEDARLLRQLPARRALRGQVPEIDEQSAQGRPKTQIDICSTILPECGHDTG
jgi:hypothetical protein